MKEQIRFALCIVLLFQSLSLAAQILSPEEMRKDIDYFYCNVLEEIHPQPYLHYTKVQIDSVRESLYEQCSDSLSIYEFSYRLGKTKKYIDGHTGFQFAPFLDMRYSINKGLFPPVSFMHNCMVINEDTIYSINGIPAKDLVKELDLLISWECHPDERQSQMNSFLSPILYNIFELDTPFVCNVHKEDLQILLDTIISPIEWELWTIEQLPEFSKESYQKPFDSEFYPEDSIAVFYYNTSMIVGTDMMKSRIDKDTLDKATTAFFDRVKQLGIKYLFIDVSYNGGGSDLAHDYFYKHLKADSYSYKTTTVAKKVGVEKFYDLLYELGEENTKEDTKNYSKRQLIKEMPFVKEMIIPLEKKGKVIKKDAVKKRKKGFEGNVYVIMVENPLEADPFSPIEIDPLRQRKVIPFAN